MDTYRQTSDLPGTLAVFPLAGALVFPRWDLPLNIFEPRYLNMIDDAMAGPRLIGMIQPAGGPRAHPALARVGCAGRITRYAETDDGRYLITLTGVCRFAVHEELAVTSPYRQVAPDWTPFAADLHAPSEAGSPDRASLVAALRAYTAALDLQADWSAVEGAPLDTLIHALASGCPFGALEKQALLEADTLAARARVLISLLEIGGSGPAPGPMQ
ncbi:MAG: peptidase S16 [Hyphomonas sp.]|uniref:LON peptidase substrate-binding domain-containing protein n=1 Tax=Hyphomonas sp. TaxID=87 RepID=UPI0017B0E62A|nr:LON peptidase substrate-binding domain-containing protein [Hyphomonas sp.]MBA3068655.1 peptidase S16 [Hyphomonas sp.]MBU3919936.1 LON peptidase substrate-binding domain-containing protein [Alphaproteobacteria bacterium]MBU4061974.1 LON peptidase substrate-binding domain-containing protein [Alphaproteobacteria bacterium]MBU4166129.1 LON peptidase substrate-binding domain-containing protein [Alphaproteobacteria bacterium]